MEQYTMSEPVVVQIVGAPIACAEGMKDSWRGVAAWTGEQLRKRFGGEVEVEYYDLFDPACPPLPSDAQLPFVYVNGEMFSSGGKISVPGLRARMEALGLETVESRR